MAFALQLHFTPEFDASIEGLWKQMSLASVPSLLPQIGNRPHLTLATFASLSEPQRLCLSAELPKLKVRLDVLFSSVGLFTGLTQMVYLAPVVDDRLRALHGDVLACLDARRIDVGPHYQRGRWIPHCTLSKELSPAHALKTLEICQSLSLPIRASVSELALVEFRPIKVLARVGC